MGEIEIKNKIWHLVYQMADDGKMFVSASSRKRFYKRHLGFENVVYCHNMRKLKNCYEKLKELNNE